MTASWKYIILALTFLVTYQLLSVTPAFAACPPIGPCPEDLGPPPSGLNEIEQMVSNVISVVAGLGFIALLVLLITAGIKYLTSGGEPKAIQAAHLTVTWALLGIVFMFISWLILLLIEGLTGIKVTVFDIKTLCGGSGIPFCKP